MNDSEKRLLEQMESFDKNAVPVAGVQSNPNNIQQNVLIDGYFLLIFIDTLFPFAIHIILKKFAGKEIPPDKIMLNDEQIKRVMPFADKSAEFLAMRVNPMFAFMVAMLTQYTRNAMGYFFENPTKL